MSKTYRCNRAICDFANALWPEMDAMMPLRFDTTPHDGVFLVGENAVPEYIRRYKPQVLRHSRKSRVYGREPMNFGIAKGLEFERVLIVPTDPIKKYLRTGEMRHIEKSMSRNKLYVAVTRAFHSVAFVYDGASDVVPNRWAPSDS